MAIYIEQHGKRAAENDFRIYLEERMLCGNEDDVVLLAIIVQTIIRKVTATRRKKMNWMLPVQVLIIIINRNYRKSW